MVKIVIIGAGPAGRFASMYAAEAGADVTLIEKSHIAGKMRPVRVSKYIGNPSYICHWIS